MSKPLTAERLRKNNILAGVLHLAQMAAVVGQLSFGDLGGNVVSLVTFIPTLAAAVRRLHDVGKSGWFILVPIYNLILLVTPSKPSYN